MKADVAQVYGNKVRIRVCGICWHQNRILLVNHQLADGQDFWAPPGGGVEFGSTVDKNLEREFLEETGLQVEVRAFLFACEFLQKPLHSVELFFEAAWRGGSLIVGSDPELHVIKDVRFVSEAELATIPEQNLHGIFKKARTEAALMKLSGFYRI